jgi:hypothetical protein
VTSPHSTHPAAALTAQLLERFTVFVEGLSEDELSALADGRLAFALVEPATGDTGRTT